MYVTEVLICVFELGSADTCNQGKSLSSEICYDYSFCLRSLQVGILSRVLEEVDKIVHEFKEMLYKKMEDPHLEISQVRACVFLLPLVFANHYLVEAGEHFIAWVAAFLDYYNQTPLSCVCSWRIQFGSCWSLNQIQILFGIISLFKYLFLPLSYLLSAYFCDDYYKLCKLALEPLNILIDKSPQAALFFTECITFMF